MYTEALDSEFILSGRRAFYLALKLYWRRV